MKKKICILRLGRLGNNIFQLMNAIYLAELYNCQIDASKLNLDHLLNIDEIEKAVNPTNEFCLETIENHCFFYISDTKNYARIGLFLHKFLRIMPETLDETTLVCHIRTGDVFEKHFGIGYENRQVV